jgi:sec-independent protein translocase protein TatB
MLSIPHLIVIFVVALVVFGPEKLPELARNLGKVMAEFRRHTSDLRSTFEGHLRDLEREADARKIGGASPAEAAPPPAPQQTIAQPAPPTPGTVPSNPPNAAAIAAAPADATPNETVSDPVVRKHPGDDPYLMGAELAPADSISQSEPSESEEKAPERVTDGDVRPA